MKTNELIEVLTQWLAYREHFIKVSCYIWSSERDRDLPIVTQQVSRVQVNSVRPAPCTLARGGSDQGRAPHWLRYQGLCGWAIAGCEGQPGTGVGRA